MLTSTTAVSNNNSDQAGHKINFWEGGEIGMWVVRTQAIKGQGQGIKYLGKNSTDNRNGWTSTSCNSERLAEPSEIVDVNGEYSRH